MKTILAIASNCYSKIKLKILSEILVNPLILTKYENNLLCVFLVFSYIIFYILNLFDCV